ncbi:unnamed protein product [Xylocopa violacea]
MIPKYKQKSYILDKMHRGVVWVCIGTTIVSTMLLVFKGFIYYRYAKPAMREAQMKASKELLEEGSYKELAG